MSTKIFISYASENRCVAEKFADALKDEGFEVWYDDFAIKPCDSISKRIGEGLRNANYGLVILSKEFFKKPWPQKELTGLIALHKKNIPLWYKINKNYVEKKFPFLVDIKSISINDDEKSFKGALEKILKVISQGDSEFCILLKMLEAIKKSGCDPNADLFVGVLKNNKDLVQDAISKGANVDVTDTQMVNYYRNILKRECSELLAKFLANIEKKAKIRMKFTKTSSNSAICGFRYHLPKYPLGTPLKSPLQRISDMLRTFMQLALEHLSNVKHVRLCCSGREVFYYDFPAFQVYHTQYRTIDKIVDKIV